MQLVSNWRDFWRMWSVRLQLLAATLLGLMETFPDAVLSAWAILPPEVRAVVPPELVRYAGFACLAAGIVARLVKQPELADRKRAIEAGREPGEATQG